MNVEELELTKQAILAEPKLFNMETWGTPTDCGAVACIAGYTALRHGLKIEETEYTRDFCYQGKSVEVQNLAQELLELNTDQALELFYVHNWPLSFRRRYDEALTCEEEARVAAEYIDHFIAQESQA